MRRKIPILKRMIARALDAQPATPKAKLPRVEAAGRGAAAADELDAAVHQILQKLKRGKSVRLPGLGTLKPGPAQTFLFEGLGGAEQKGAGHGGKKPGRG
jgi:hypothetical protein